MKAIDFNILRGDAYNTACEHGFHDKELSNEHCLCLVISELMEAVEADRKGNYAYQKISSTSRYTSFPTAENRFKKEFNAFIKDTVEDELADAVIRLLDICGLRGIDVTVTEESIEDDSSSCRDETFTETIYQIATMYERQRITYDWRLDKILNNMLSAIFGLAKYLNIDLLWHIEQKMKYNKLREKMHGKKY